MYSYGSSARVGVGKQGHGGREYRPPRKRRDPNATPPPLKQCACLCQLDLPEYLVTTLTPPTVSSRTHATFGGREALQDLERQLRSIFLVHLVVPGRKQAGPVAVVGQTYQQALPAVAYLLQRLGRLAEQGNANANVNSTVTGRIQRQVQDPNDVALEGHWCFVPPPSRTGGDFSPLLQIAWIFQSPPQFSVMACFTTLEGEENDENDEKSNENTENMTTTSSMLAMETLQISIDNFKFRMGNTDSVEMCFHDDPFIALAAGPPLHTKALYEEVEKSLVATVEKAE
jgi:hypothetical protein